MRSMLNSYRLNLLNYMIKSSDLKPGRMYSFVYNAPVEMVQKRDGIDNPIYDLGVSVRRVVSCQAAGAETYENVMRKRDAAWQPSEDFKAWWKTSDDNSCVVQHKKDASRRYLRAIPRGISQEKYFIGDVEATDSQVKLIQAFKKSKSDREPVYVLFNLDNIVNLRDE